MATAELQSSLAQFATFARSLKGDEKGEAQLFLDKFFRALGHGGVQEAGATLEFRIAKKPGSAQLELIKGEPAAKMKGGKKFADLLWPDRVLIEMKSRKEKNLEKHYDQTFEYWTHIVPKRPPYVILCNFDEFWIYDFNTQLFDPVERIHLRELAESADSLGFLLPKPETPRFGNNRVEVTRKAADAFAEVFRKIVNRGEDRTRAQRFILQLLVSVVSEDIGLLPDNFVTNLLQLCAERPADSFDLLGGLFRQMATQEQARGGRYAGIEYFNGGLFSLVDPIELKLTEADMLFKAADRHDWSQVKPEIFGTLFQHSMDAGERHAFGAHFTSEFDIQKVVGPTIVRPWRERIEAAKSDKAALLAALGDLRKFQVLDPACGSGNFLFVAYREMKRLERNILTRLQRAKAQIKLTSAVSIQQCHGLDTQPFAVELAKVTLMLAKELELREADRLGASEGLFFQEKPLPLDNLDANIRCADALFTEWPKADAIIGNPPYLGSRFLAQEHGYEYARKVHARFPDVPKMADFCTHWFRLAHDALPSGGRAGLVGTNTIRQNESREASLDYIVENGGVITEAIATQVWSGDAAVHVSIVNWVKGNGPGAKRLTTQVGDKASDPWKVEEVEIISPTLSNTTDVSSALALAANQKPKAVYVGQYPFHEGFLLTPDEAAAMIHAEPKSREVLFPYMIGRDLVEEGGPTRWSIDFGQNDIFFARGYPLAFERVKVRVMPDVVAHAEAEKAKTGKATTRWTRVAQRWWQFRDYQPGTIAAIKTLPRYVAVSRVTKRPIFEFVSSAIRPDNALVVFPFADDYSFGILSSGVHFAWFKARCSTLKGDFRYTSDTVFDTFPWPQTPTKAQIAEVAAAAVALRALRREIMGKLGYSLRELYRTLEDPGANPLREAHSRLDTAVRDAYEFHSAETALADLLELNAELAAKERSGTSITPPGLPLPTPEQAAFTTEDCIGVLSETVRGFVKQAHEGQEESREIGWGLSTWQIRKRIRRNNS